MKTKFNEKLNVQKKDKLIELEIENLSLMEEHNSNCLNSYSIYLDKKSTKLLIQKLQKLVE